MLVGIVWRVWLQSKSPEVVERIHQDLKSNRPRLPFPFLNKPGPDGCLYCHELSYYHSSGC